MIPFEQLLTRRENLYSAWEKVRNFYLHDAVFVDEVALAAFGANLEKELEAIAEQFVHLQYELALLKPFPYPKRKKNDADTGVRQYFDISIRDQVAWVAFVNIVGPWLDDGMPTWSYGNRLHRTAWIDEEGEKRRLHIGWYRHSRGVVYRRFTHSWPLFRRHIYLTVRAMTRTLKDDAAPLDKAEQWALEENYSLPDRYRLPYLEHDFWNVGRRRKSNDLYWASIDIEKFYPRVTTKLILDNMIEHLSLRGKGHAESIKQLAEHLLSFKMDFCGWQSEQLRQMDIDDSSPHLDGIPTGLIVAGFLANVALQGTDHEVQRQLAQKKSPFHRRIAHFRYVDDHVILARDFPTLKKWLTEYQEAIVTIGLNINWAKTQPEELGKLFLGDSKVKDGEAAKACLIDDPLCPTPLMTETLALVSQVARTDFLLLSEEEQARFLHQVEHLLLTEFPDEEIRRDTRMSFAASVLTHCVPKRSHCQEALVQSLRKLHRCHRQKDELLTKLADLHKGGQGATTVKGRISRICTEIDRLAKLASEQKRTRDIRLRREGLTTFRLLEKAVRTYAEKPRLWFHLVRFFRRSGWGSADVFLKLIEETAQINALLPAFFRSLLLRSFSAHVINAAVCITSADHTQREQTAARRFLSGLEGLEPLMTEQEGVGQPWEHVSEGMFRAALGMANEIVREKDTGDEWQQFADFSERVGAADWRKRITQDILPVHAPVSWYIWMDSLVASSGGEIPSGLMKRILRRAPTRNPLTWDLFAGAIGLLPESPKVLSRLLSSDLPVLAKENEGWLLQVLRRVKNPDSLSVGADKQEVILRSIRAEQTCPEGTVSLIDWFSYAPDSPKDLAYDPRYSEWSCLEIVRQLANQLISIEFHRWWKKEAKQEPSYPINPANILLPVGWTKPATEQPRSWERWQLETRNVSEEGSRRYKQNHLVHDARYWPTLLEPSHVHGDWVNVYACGLLLLGLVRGTFDLPGEWCRPSKRRAISARTRRMIHDVQCSSHTLAILDACLLERPYETRQLPLLQDEPPDEDTTYDPPQIPTLDVLTNHLWRAQHTLEKHQVTVQDYRPRQLVPVDLRQLARPSLLMQADEERES